MALPLFFQTGLLRIHRRLTLRACEQIFWWYFRYHTSSIVLPISGLTAFLTAPPSLMATLGLQSTTIV